jgi:tungstate transport system ATP-binding protein
VIGVEIESLRVERAGRVVLEIPSLVLRPNRTTAILGPNGAGKSTLLRTIAALDLPLRGRILLGGRPVHPDTETRRNIAFVFQQPVFLRQSVRHNLELALRLRGLAPPERQQRVADAAHLLGITSLLDRQPSRLSEGERRRASLARALCLHSPLLLLDEPLAGLDSPNHQRLLDELPGLLHGRGTTTIVVTHDRREALRLADDVVVLIEGRVHASGDKQDVVSRPASPRVAEILGFSVLAVNGRLVAVPLDGLAVGPGPHEFSMVVEHVVDLVNVQEIAGRIDRARVRLVAACGAGIPKPGDRLCVHAARVFDLDDSAPGFP